VQAKQTASGAPVALSGSAPYTFAMPAADVTVSAEFVSLASSAKELLTFSFGSWAGTVDEGAKTVSVTVPYGTPVSGITPTATVSTGADYSPKAPWGPGPSKTYTVTAEDGTTVAYTVTVTVAANTVYNITISASANGTVTADTNSTTVGTIVTLTANPNTNYSLKAGTLQVKETASGASVTVSSSAPYTFAMPAADVTVSAEFASSAKKLETFVFSSWTGTVDEGAKTVSVTVPYGTVITNIAPVITHTGASISPDTGAALDFTTQQTYTVTAEDGTTAAYTVTVTVAAATVYNITINPSLNGTVTASVAGTTVTGTVEAATVSLTATPNTSYGLKAGTLQVKETVSNTAVSVSGSGPYTFEMPAADVTVSAEFVTILSSVAQRGATLYASLKNAIEAAAPTATSTSPDEIILLQDIFLPEGAETAGYTINKHIKLASGSVGHIIKRKSGFNDSLFTVSSGASLTLDSASNDLVIDGDKDSTTVSDPLIMVSGGTLNMHNRVILRNNINTLSGGAVYVTGSGSTFTMSGGTISDNKATGGTGNGGGVYVTGNGSSFTMSGGTISDNETLNNTTNGGGVYVSDSGRFDLSGTAQITGNKAGHNGGGVYVAGSNSTFTMSGGTISGGGLTNAENGGGVMVNLLASFEMSSGVIIENSALNGGGVYMSSGGSFAMSGTATITGNTASNNGGGVYATGSGSNFTMNGGTISGGGVAPKNAANGGGVLISSNASFVMNSGSIVENKATQGGGVFISGGETVTLTSFIMASGSISKNNATSFGGGVCIIGKHSRFAMQGGTIGGISEANTAGNGNGVYVGNLSEFAMSGTSSLVGANGVHINTNATFFSMEGGATVDLVDQIYLESGKFVTLSGNLTGIGPRARIEPASASATWGTTKVLDGAGTLIHDNKAMFTLRVSSQSYPGSTHINDTGIITGP
jgi:parallel beta-helix repeat protein